jgi:MFS family permease
MVLFAAWLGWVFDAMDSTLYVLVLHPALQDLLGAGADKTSIAEHGAAILALFLGGWAIGGILFGVAADRFGRARVMVVTIFIYAVFTGMAALAQTWWQLAAFRFLTALGVGGEWACGVALVAEVFPERSRAKAAGVLNGAWAVGFFLASIINLIVTNWIGPLFPTVDPWRFVFLVGIIPAFVAAWIRRRFHEPERWVRAHEREQLSGEKSASIMEIFRPPWRGHTVVATSMAAAAVIGLWGMTYWVPSFIRELPLAGAWTETETKNFIDYLMMALNLGALAGYLSFWPIAERCGRPRTFLFFFAGSVILAQLTFLTGHSMATLFLLIPVLGFFNSGMFSGFAGYFPELFPTRLRTTGAGFCFNAGRTFAAVGPIMAASFVALSGSHAEAARAVGWIYLIGAVVALFAPETRGRKLPD